ncbi:MULTISPECIES: barstar family protein [Bacillus]|nr:MULTISPECIES: barstar family protein [Bacillus]MEB9830740.1 barstar family protein [Bacillus cereus]
MHKILKNKLDLPNYYGENADALWYWLTAWGTLPLTIEWEFFNEFPERILLPQACEGCSPTVGGR